MLKMVGAAAIAMSVGLAGAAMAQTVRAPVPANSAEAVLGKRDWVLVKHDKHDKWDNGRGRKLGHYKHRDRDRDDDDEDRTRRSSTRSSTWSSTRWSRGGATPAWVDPAPVPYFALPPYYGYSYPPPAYYHGY